MVLVQQRFMQSNQRLPVIVRYFCITLPHYESLGLVDVNTFRFDHRKSRIYQLDLSGELLLTDSPGIWLQEHVWPPSVNRHCYN